MKILFIWQLSPYILHSTYRIFCTNIDCENVVFIEEKEVCFCTTQEICVFLCRRERDKCKILKSVGPNLEL